MKFFEEFSLVSLVPMTHILLDSTISNADQVCNCNAMPHSVASEVLAQSQLGENRVDQNIVLKFSVSYFFWADTESD